MKNLKLPNKVSQLINKENKENETTLIYNKNNIAIYLTYPKNRELKAKTFINDTKQELEEILDAIQFHDANITIHINDTGKDLKEYNTVPYGGKSSRVYSYITEKKYFIYFSLDDVSGLFHELSHVLDYDSKQTYKQLESFKNIHKQVVDVLNKIPETYYDKRDRKQRIKYESSKEEVLVRTLNQHYCRTHKENIYADQLKPLPIDIVLDVLYKGVDSFKADVDNLINSIKETDNRIEYSRTDIINTNHINKDEYEELAKAIMELYEQNSLNITP